MKSSFITHRLIAHSLSKEVLKIERIYSFWKVHLPELFRPWGGHDDPIEALLSKEKELGLILPETFKKLYSIQDGGYTHFSAYKINEIELLHL